MKKKLKLVIGCDHAAPDMKAAVADDLRKKGYEVTDVGVFSTESCDYPDVAHLLCLELQNQRADLGILICGTGIGMSIAANKHHGIRAACCSDLYSAEMTRRHNDANVLCFGARVVNLETALRLVDTFITTDFEGGRHQKRVDKLAEIEESEAKKYNATFSQARAKEE